MIKLLILTLLMSISGYSKSLFIDKYDIATINMVKNHVITLTFKEDVLTAYTGDTKSISTSKSDDNKTIALKVVGPINVSTNLFVKTKRRQYNILLKASDKSPLFYYIYDKSRLTKNEIYRKSTIKDRDIIETVSKLSRTSKYKLKLHDKEMLDETHINIRVKPIVNLKGAIILGEDIILAQGNKNMSIMFRNYNKDKNIISVTGQIRKVGSKIKILVPIKYEGKKFVAELNI